MTDNLPTCPLDKGECKWIEHGEKARNTNFRVIECLNTSCCYRCNSEPLHVRLSSLRTEKDEAVADSLVPIRDYQVHKWGARGLRVVIPRIWLKENNICVGDMVFMYRCGSGDLAISKSGASHNVGLSCRQYKVSDAAQSNICVTIPRAWKGVKAGDTVRVLASPIFDTLFIRHRRNHND